MFSYLERAVAWLKAGYPQGIPSQDYIPLLAVLQRRMSEEEIEELGEQLTAKGLVPADHVDVGSRYVKMVNELPSTEELARVTRKLEQAGWQIDDPAWRQQQNPS